MKKTLTLLLCLAVVQLFAGTNPNKESNHLLLTKAVSQTSIWEVNNGSAFSFAPTVFLKQLPTEDVLQDKVAQSANQSAANIPCGCNTDKYVIANPGVRKIRNNETNLYYNLGTPITLTPQNICNPANCLTQWRMKVFDAVTELPLPSGGNSGNTTILQMTLNSLAGYKVEFTGTCNGQKCNLIFWIKPK